MMRWIIGSSLRLRFLVVAVAAAMVFVGLAQLRTMPVDTLPEFTPPTVEIQTEALGLAAPEVEQLITVPMEQDLLNGVAWLQEIRSESVPGLSRIELIFQPGTDILRARQAVQERLTQAHALPNVSKPPQMLQPVSSTSRLMMVRLSSQQLSAIDLSVLARWTVTPRLVGVPGVANVAIWGQRDRQLQVQVDPQKLQAQGITLLDVIETTGNALWVSPLTFLEASTPGTGGFIDTPNQRISIQHVMPITTPQDLAQVPVAEVNGTTLRLADVATVAENNQPQIGDAVAADGSTDLMVVIEKFPEANTLEVTKGVEAALDGLRPGLTGVAIDTTVYRPATFIELAIDHLAATLLVGLVLVALVFLAFFFEWRSALIALVAVPLSVIAAAFVLYLRGATFNIMVLAGLVIALGAVIDDAVADVDNIKRRLRQPRQAGDDRSTAAVILDAALETRGPLFPATLIMLLAVVPLYFLGFRWGLPGAFFGPIALSYALAVAASLLVAATVTPALAMLLLKRAPVERRESPLQRGLERGYDWVVSRVVRRPRFAYAAVGLLMAIGLVAAPFLKPSMLPALQERDLLIRWQAVAGTSQPEMDRITALAVDELRSVPGITNVGAHIGRALGSDQAVEINSGELWVSIDPAANYDKTIAAIQHVVDGYPGIAHNVLTYPAQRMNEVLTGSPHPVVVRIHGQDLAVLRSKAEEVRQLLASTAGVVDPRVQAQPEQPTLEVQVDLADAQQYGIKPGDVRRAATTLLSGLLVGNLYMDQKVFDVVVWGAPSTRDSLTAIQDLLIDTPGGGHVRLGDVAEVRVAPTPPVIKHEGVSRYVDVTADVSGRDLGAVTRDVQQKVQSLSFPLEYHAEVLSDAVARQATEQRLLGFALAAALGVFLLLQAAFGSWRLAALVFLTLPSAPVGGVLAAFAGDRALSLGALIGLFAVLGIAVRNGMSLLGRYQHLERAEGEALGPALVARGAREQLVPTLMTALATALAMLPLAVGGDVFGHEIVRPLAVVSLGGLVTATLLNLFVLPSLYLRFATSEQPEPSTAQLRVAPAPSAAAD